MSSTNNIRCNTVIINNHASRPSYKEVLVSNSVQPSAPKDYSKDKRSTGIGSDAKVFSEFKNKIYSKNVKYFIFIRFYMCDDQEKIDLSFFRPLVFEKRQKHQPLGLGAPWCLYFLFLLQKYSGSDYV